MNCVAVLAVRFQQFIVGQRKRLVIDRGNFGMFYQLAGRKNIFLERRLDLCDRRMRYQSYHQMLRVKRLQKSNVHFVAHAWEMERSDKRAQRFRWIDYFMNHVNDRVEDVFALAHSVNRLDSNRSILESCRRPLYGFELLIFHVVLLNIVRFCFRGRMLKLPSTSIHLISIQRIRSRLNRTSRMNP